MEEYTQAPLKFAKDGRAAQKLYPHLRKDLLQLEVGGGGDAYGITTKEERRQVQETSEVIGGVVKPINICQRQTVMGSSRHASERGRVANKKHVEEKQRETQT